MGIPSLVLMMKPYAILLGEKEGLVLLSWVLTNCSRTIFMGLLPVCRSPKVYLTKNKPQKPQNKKTLQKQSRRTLFNNLTLKNAFRRCSMKGLIFMIYLENYVILKENLSLSMVKIIA
ncbi:MAG: hypothetical protein WC612_02900 [Bdellovibrionales bacterium]|jgi:hypothetical protein